MSCVNARLEDLEAAAAGVLEGKKVAPRREALRGRRERARSRRRPSGAACGRRCSTPAPSRCRPAAGRASASVRGCSSRARWGSPPPTAISRGAWARATRKCYLASPAVVAASAVAGYITGPAHVEGRRCRNVAGPAGAAPAASAEQVEILAASRRACTGRLVFLPQDNLNTDGIYGKDYTYKELSREEMARVVMENYDPAFAASTRGRRHGGRRFQLRHRLLARAGGDRAAGQGDPARDRRVVLPDLPAQRIQQRLSVHRDPGAGPRA